MSDVAAIDKWVQNARAIAALAGIEVHLLDRKEIVVTRDSFTQSVRTRRDLANVLRLMGCRELPEPPP